MTFLNERIYKNIQPKVLHVLTNSSNNLKILSFVKVDDDAVIDVIDRVCPFVVESFLNQLPPAEKVR